MGGEVGWASELLLKVIVFFFSKVFLMVKKGIIKLKLITNLFSFWNLDFFCFSFCFLFLFFFSIGRKEKFPCLFIVPRKNEKGWLFSFRHFFSKFVKIIETKKKKKKQPSCQKKLVLLVGKDEIREARIIIYLFNGWTPLMVVFCYMSEQKKNCWVFIRKLFL